MAGVLETFTVPRATTFPAAAATSAPIRTSSFRSLLRSRRSVKIQSSYATSSRGLVTRRLGHRRGNRIVCEAQNTAIEGNPGGFHKYRHLWVQCDVCYGLNYKPHFNSQMYICESCEYHVEMNSSDRIDLLIDPNTWVPMDEDMVSRAIEWDFEEKEEPFKLDLSEWEAELKKVSTELELRIQLKKEKEKADRERIDSEEDDQTYQEHLDFEDKGKTDQDLLSLEEDRCDSEKMGEFRYDLQGRREE